MLTELRQLLTEAGESKTVKVIVIGHEGPVFSSGHDLKELTRERGTEYHKQVFDLCSEVMKLVQVMDGDESRRYRAWETRVDVRGRMCTHRELVGNLLH